MTMTRRQFGKLLAGTVLGGLLPVEAPAAGGVSTAVFPAWHLQWPSNPAIILWDIMGRPADPATQARLTEMYDFCEEEVEVRG